jgi:hypothetical protein
LNGDGRADIIARDSGGALLLYRGNGTTLVSKTVAGVGWNSMSSIQ